MYKIIDLRERCRELCISEQMRWKRLPYLIATHAMTGNHANFLWCFSAHCVQTLTSLLVPYLNTKVSKSSTKMQVVHKKPQNIYAYILLYKGWIKNLTTAYYYIGHTGILKCSTAPRSNEYVGYKLDISQCWIYYDNMRTHEDTRRIKL